MRSVSAPLRSLNLVDNVIMSALVAIWDMLAENEKAPTKKTNPQTAFTMGSHCFAIDEGGMVCIVRIVKVVMVTSGIVETSECRLTHSTTGGARENVGINFNSHGWHVLIILIAKCLIRSGSRNHKYYDTSRV